MYVDEISGVFRKFHVNERLCPVCNNDEIEDEIHFVLACPAYRIPRNLMFNKMRLIDIDSDKYSYLMKNRWKELTNYASDAWQIRKNMMYKT